MIQAGSISYLHILSSYLRSCAAMKGYCEIPKFEFLANFLETVTLALSCYDMGSDMNA